MEAEWVVHCGGNVSGTFLNTLVLTDIATGWGEGLPLLKKSADDVILGLRLFKDLLPSVCNNVIFASLPWTSANYDQAVGHFDREGFAFDRLDIHMSKDIRKTGLHIFTK